MNWRISKVARNKGSCSYFGAGSAIKFTLPFLLASCALSPAQRDSTDSDWALARSIRGKSASPLHRAIFGNSPLDGNLYRRFFDERVKHIEAEGIGYASCHGAFACAQGSTIRLSSGYSEIPSVIRLSFLLHEARHAEGYDHEACPAELKTKSPYQGKALAGTRECDETALGANGIQIVMLNNIARFCESCEAKTRHEAGAFADYLLELVSPSAKRVLREDFSN